MKKGLKCNKSHREDHPHFVLERKLNDKGFPTHSSKYQEAHRKANEAEEKKYGKKSFKVLERLDKKVSKHELIGKNLKRGKLEVSKKVPKRYREEVAYHEEIENENLRKNHGMDKRKR